MERIPFVQDLLKKRSSFHQLLLFMRFTSILLLIGAIHVSGKSFSQTVTLSAKKMTLEKVFIQIKAQTGYSFLVNGKDLDKNKTVSFEVSNAPLNEVLSLCLSGTGMSYSIEGKVVFIKAAPAQNLIAAPPAAPPGGIRGRITDDKGNPLSGVTVRIVKRGIAAESRSDGTYAINGRKGDVLEFSYVGHKTAEVPVADQVSINVTLERNTANLDQVVVIGYGSMQKKDVTGSLSVVSSKDLEDVPFNTLDNALAGKVAGVQVTKTDGTPGGAVRIRVRGSTSLRGGNTPLYVIDGVPVEVQSDYLSPGYDLTSPVGNTINGVGGLAAGMSASFVNGLNTLGALNVDDIESVTVLKDASATAIYGSKAANGVVIITTKRGHKDTRPQIQLSYYGTGTKSIDPKLLDAQQYKTLITEAAQNDYDARGGIGVPGNVTAVLNQPSTFFGNANTDWLKEVTRTPWSDNAELSVQGGGAASRYYTSIGYNSTPGVITGTNYQRVSGKMSLENEISKSFRVTTNVNLGYTNQNITNGAYGQALVARPDYAPRDSSGGFTNFAGVGYSYQGFQNPLALTTALDNSKTLSLLGSLSAQYNFTPDFFYKGTVSLNMQDYNQRNYTPSYVTIAGGQGAQASVGGIGSNSNSNFDDWFVENTLTYARQLGKDHTLDVLAGTSYETTKTSFFSATAEGFPNDNVLNSLSSAETPLYTKGDDPEKPQSYLLSFYVRANYGYKDKYLLTFTGRSDGSSKFGPENKFGYFPSGAVAWRLSKENFLKHVSWIDDIKLRGSYGLTGTQNIGDQMYRSLYTPYSYNGNNALVPTQLGNAAIRWETTAQTDAGLDVSLFKGRLQGTFDYYDKLTSNALLSLPVAASTSYSSLLQNVASIRNRGVELALQGDLIRTRDFRWSASANITWNKSLVTKLNNTANLSQIAGQAGLEYSNTTLIQGQPLGLILGYKVTGIIKTQEQLTAYKNKLGLFQASYPWVGIGDPMFLLDTVTYAAYNSALPMSNTIIASAAPKFFGGFTQEFSYKSFDLNFYFTFSGGGKLLWGEHAGSMEFQGTSNADAIMLNRWTPQNPNSNYPRLLLGDDPYLTSTNLSVFNSSYIKLRTVTLNYHLKKNHWMQRKGLQNASVFLSATNLFTITKYPGPDPEVSDDPYSVSGGYFDTSNYPTVKTLSVGLKAGF
jgi:TonB-linked SusC/RagA family outer membrane protein